MCAVEYDDDLQDPIGLRNPRIGVRETLQLLNIHASTSASSQAASGSELERLRVFARASKASCRSSKRSVRWGIVGDLATD